MNNHLTVSELEKTARDAMHENGFETEYPPQILEELHKFEDHKVTSVDASIIDLRKLLWSSIDNDSSKDLDQVEYAERMPNGDIKLLIGVADVDEYVPKGSAIDEFASHNTVSVYTEGKVFPMLPEELSTNLTSLLEVKDRIAIVVEMFVTPDGDVPKSDVYRALVRNYAKLTYGEVGAWLDENAAEPKAFEETAGLKEQVVLQHEIAKRLHAYRRAKGALEFESIESVPVFDGDKAKDLNIVRSNSARKIIENFMIAANVEMAEYLEAHGMPSIRRVVKTPANWGRICDIAREYGERLPDQPDSRALADFLAKRRSADPDHFPDLSLSIVKLIGAGDYTVKEPGVTTDGHFGLATRDYTHSTAPNRRYPDLITQRLVKAVIAGKPSPYTVEELNTITEQCNERESMARKVERKMRKVVAAGVMQSHIGETFAAIVTGITPKGTFARILRPPVDGRVVRGEESLRVGEKVNVRLLSTNTHNGFIDFGYQR